MKFNRHRLILGLYVLALIVVIELAASAAPAPEMSSRAAKPEKPTDPRIEARNARYEEFKAAGYDRRIELFERTLNEPLLMDGEMAFSMLSEIFDGAVERDERDRHNQCVERLRTTLPDVYEEDAAFLLENCVCNAIVMRRDERIHAYTLELAALAEKKFENWHRTESQLAYHGYLRTLITAMRRAWPKSVPRITSCRGLARRSPTEPSNTRY
jgi:hypothetical protein